MFYSCAIDYLNNIPQVLNQEFFLSLWQFALPRLENPVYSPIYLKLEREKKIHAFP